MIAMVDMPILVLIAIIAIVIILEVWLDIKIYELWNGTLPQIFLAVLIIIVLAALYAWSGIRFF